MTIDETYNAVKRLVDQVLDGNGVLAPGQLAELGVQLAEKVDFLDERIAEDRVMPSAWRPDPGPSGGGNWAKLEADVLARIRALAAIADGLDAPAELRAKIREDLILPNVRLLAAFCANVQIDEEEPA